MVDPLDAVAERVGLDAQSPALRTALTHSSYAAEHDVVSNERLEFLGDAVVDLSIADLIVREYPELDEGTGSLVRSRVVNESALAEVATALELGEALLVGRGVKKEEGVRRPSLLADAFEAVVAAIYLERGYEAARDFVQAQLAEEVRRASLAPADVDPKTRLRQWAEAAGLGTPRYVITEDGPAHQRAYRASVSIGASVRASGEGRSKKAAEARAARAAWDGRLDA